MNDAVFSQLDFGPLNEFLKDDNVTDISYTNGGQVWLKTLDKGVYQVDRPEINNALMEKLAFQCANVMGKTFNMAHPMLDAESAELRLNFIHDSIATNGIACVIRKTPAKIRLNKEKLLNICKKIHRLDEKTKEVVYLRIGTNFNFRKISNIIGQSEDYARTIFYRAKIKLKEELNDE